MTMMKIARMLKPLLQRMVKSALQVRASLDS